MFTWGSKYLFGIATVAWIAALAYGIITGGDPLGVVSFGYKGGVGDHLGYTLLLAVSLGSWLIGGTVFATRDSDAETMARLAGSDSVPQVTPPATPSYWGAVTAFGVACLLLGAAVSIAFLILGIAVLVVVGLEWMTLAWSDRATGDAEVNAVIRERFIGPMELPMLGSLFIAVVVIAISRVLLTVSATGAVVIGTIIAVVIFGTAVAFAKVDVPKRVVTGALALGALLVLAGGLVGAVRGERDFEHHETDDHSEVEEGLGLSADELTR